METVVIDLFYGGEEAPDIHNEKPNYRIEVEEVGLIGFKLKPMKLGEVWLIPSLKVSVNLPGDVKGIHLSRITKLLVEFFNDQYLHLEEFESLCRRIASTHEFISKVKLEFKSKVIGGDGWIGFGLLTLLTWGFIERKIYSFRFLTINVCPCSLVVSQHLYGKPYSHLQKSRINVEVETRQTVNLWRIVEAVKEKIVEPKVVLNRFEESKTLMKLYSQPMFNEDLTRETLITVYRAIRDSLDPNDKIRVFTVSYETLHPYRVFSKVEYKASDLEREKLF